MAGIAAAKRVVVSGLGLVLPTGIGKDPYWQALQSVRSCTGALSRFTDPAVKDVAIAAEINGFEIKDFTTSKLRKYMDRAGAYAVAATHMCIADAELDLARDGRRVDLCIGTCCGALAWGEEQYRKVLATSLGALHPHTSIKAYPGNLIGLVTIILGIRGRGLVFSNLDSSGIDALRYGCDLIRTGRSSLVLAGATEAPLTPCVYYVLQQAGLLSQRVGRPEAASRPFDTDRDGLVLGEGAVMLLLEERSHALHRGARVYAEIRGHAVAEPVNGNGHAPSTAHRALDTALRDAGVAPERLGYVNAGACSLPDEDRREAEALQEIFGAACGEVPVSSTRSVVGYPLSLAAPLQAATCALAMAEEALPPNGNLERTDPGCYLRFLREPLRARPHYMLQSTFSCLQGRHAGFVYARPEEEHYEASVETSRGDRSRRGQLRRSRQEGILVHPQPG